jgi:Na+/melibiose symporter-like transporter
VQVIGMDPGLAGLLMLIGQIIDAIVTPAIGVISDHIYWQRYG